jgi:hypothetical protein
MGLKNNWLSFPSIYSRHLKLKEEILRFTLACGPMRFHILRMCFIVNFYLKSINVAKFDRYDVNPSFYVSIKKGKSA